MRQILIAFLMLWATSAFGATNTYYVNPAAAADGDGTTTGTTGADCAFDNLNDFADLDADCSSDIYICEISGTGADTTKVFFDGWTNVDALGQIVVNVAVAYRHDGTRGTGYYLNIDDAGGAIYLADPYITLNGLSLTNSNGSGEGVSISSDGDYSVITNTLVYDCDGTAGVLIASNGTNCIMINSFIYGCGRGISLGAEPSIIANCTVMNSGDYGISRTNYVNASVYNTFVGGSGTSDYYETGTSDSFNIYYSMSEDATVDDYGEGDNQTPNVTYDTNLLTNVTATSENGNLPVGSTLIDAAHDYDGETWWSSYCENVGDGTDYTDVTRAGTWDIGPDEYAAAGVTSEIYSHYRSQQ